jgi:hypothetical protein
MSLTVCLQEFTRVYKQIVIHSKNSVTKRRRELWIESFARFCRINVELISAEA